MTSPEDGSVCVQCGQPAPELYKRFTGGIIKISQCMRCSNIADKYIEYDGMVIFLDALLHKPQAYRHILFNSNIQWHWKMLLILIICDTYQKWERHQMAAPAKSQGTDTNLNITFNAALEWDFYCMFFIATIEWIALCIAIIVLLRLVSMLGWTRYKSGPTVQEVLKGVIVSSFGKLFIVPASIWDQSQSPIFILMTQLFICTSNVAALKVQFGLSRWMVTSLLVIAYIIQKCTSLWIWDIFFS